MGRHHSPYHALIPQHIPILYRSIENCFMKQQLLFVFFFLGIQINAQIQDTTFHKVFYESSMNIVSKSGAVSADDGLVIVGEADNTYAYMMKIDSAGTFEWFKKANAQSGFKKVIRTWDSTFVAIGGQFNVGNMVNDAFIVKFDVNGDTLWTKTIEHPTGLSLNTTSIVESIDSNYLICGYTLAQNNSFVIKISASGDLIWSTIFNPINSSLAQGITYGPDSTIYMCGQYNDGVNFVSSYIASFEHDGTPISSTGYTSVDFYDIIYHMDSLFVLGAQSADIFISRMATDGQIDWMNNYFYVWDNTLDKMHLHTTTNGNLITMVGDRMFSTNAIEITPEGFVINQKNVIMDGVDLLETQKNGYFLLGYGPLYGIKLVQVDHLGVIRLDETFSPSNECIWDGWQSNNPTIVSLASTTLQSNGTLVENELAIAFSSELMLDYEGCVDIWGGIDESDLPEISVYPVPATDKVHFKQDQDLTFSLVLTDLTGRTVIQRAKVIGETSVDVSGLHQGNYIYTITFDNDQVRTGKLNILR